MPMCGGIHPKIRGTTCVLNMATLMKQEGSVNRQASFPHRLLAWEAGPFENFQHCALDSWRHRRLHAVDQGGLRRLARFIKHVLRCLEGRQQCLSLELYPPKTVLSICQLSATAGEAMVKEASQSSIHSTRRHKLPDPCSDILSEEANSRTTNATCEKVPGKRRLGSMSGFHKRFIRVCL